MSKNSILEELRREVVQAGVEVQIGPRKFLVMKPTRSDTMEAISKAKSETDISPRSGMAAKESELKQVLEIFPEMNLKKKADREWATDFLSNFSKALIPLVLRKEDGSRVAETNQDGKLLVELIGQIDGAENAISKALTEAQKKSSTTGSK